jgi:hypothetical protein
MPLDGGNFERLVACLPPIWTRATAVQILPAAALLFIQGVQRIDPRRTVCGSDARQQRDDAR